MVHRSKTPKPADNEEKNQNIVHKHRTWPLHADVHGTDMNMNKVGV